MRKLWLLLISFIVIILAIVGYDVFFTHLRAWTILHSANSEHMQSLILRPDYYPAQQVSSSSLIPYRLLMTYKDLSLIPSKVYSNLQQYAPEYTLQLYDDATGLAFLEQYFHPIVRQTFLRTKKGAHKADLLRYCLIYIFGGVYMDIKTVLIRPLRELVHDPRRSDVTLYLILDNDEPRSWFKYPGVYNGILASVPRNPFFLQLIYNFIETKVVWYYLIFVRQCFLLLEEELLEPMAFGRPLQGKNNRIYLFKQHCTRNADMCPDGLDRYRYCCYIYDKDEKAFKVRYSDFPWTEKQKP